MKKSFIFRFILLLSLLISSVCMLSSVVYAQETNAVYSSVLDDLCIDTLFDINDYPAVSDDYSLQVIQIAESIDKELLVYVYQPSNGAKDYTASSINISTAINDSLKYQNYKLQLLSREGVFCKYLVKDFELKPDAMRYYDISSIFRPYDATIDTGLSETNENNISEVSYEVGKLYTAVTVNNTVTYSCLDTETILITDKHFGYIRYNNGFKLYADKCDSWYVAFSTDKPIDRLMEADVSFVKQSYFYSCTTTAPPVIREELGSEIPEEVSLKYTDIASNPADGLFGNKYVWNRIESVDEFIKNEDLSDEALDKLENKSWVLRFYESEFSTKTVFTEIRTESTIVSEVTILRLKFETDGEVYNLGVVDNKQSLGENQGSDNNNPNELEDPVDWAERKWEELMAKLQVLFDKGKDILKYLGVAIITILIIVLFAPILPYLIKFVIFIVLLPFRLIYWLIKGICNAFGSKHYK